jgi:uncharacterized protein (DUF1697 family)
MARSVALLRAVNVGGHRPVPMADLCALAGEIGFRDAATYIASGNLVFKSDLGEEEAAARLATGIERRFGFPVDVLVRSRSRWTRYLAGNPFPAEDPARVVLLLPQAPPPRGAVEALAARAEKGERLVLAGDAVWGHFPAGIGASKLTAPVIDRHLGSPTTARNLRTVVAIGDLL